MTHDIWHDQSHIRFQKFQDYKFGDVTPVRRRASPVVVPGGVVGVPLPLRLGSICISCAETATPQTWGKEKSRAVWRSPRCAKLFLDALYLTEHDYKNPFPDEGHLSITVWHIFQGPIGSCRVLATTVPLGRICPHKGGSTTVLLYYTLLCTVV